MNIMAESTSRDAIFPAGHKKTKFSVSARVNLVIKCIAQTGTKITLWVRMIISGHPLKHTQKKALF
jgi:hypothetical protein